MSQDPANPFSSPVNPYAVETQTPQGGPSGGRGLINQLGPLGICMMVQGGLEAVMAIGLGVFAMIFPTILAQQQGNQPMPPNLQPMMQIMYATFAAVLLVVAVLHILAGIRVQRYDSRVLAFVALGSGFLTFFGCYCMPTAMALFVWGLIVLVNGPVTQAFQLKEQGRSKEEIDRMLV
ncbi:MAG: hypothetical protein AAFX06_15685 [Planctomycetota bacterium]